MQIKCAQCGAKVVAKNSRRKYCSRRCIEKADRIRKKSKRVSPLTPRSCEKCGARYQPKTGIQKYCSSECKYQIDKQRIIESNPAKQEMAQCPVCTAFFAKRSGVHRFCSDGCRSRAGKAKKRMEREALKRIQEQMSPKEAPEKDESTWEPPRPERKFRRRECVVCGEVFRPKTPLQKACSDICRDELRVQKNRRIAINKKGERVAVAEAMGLLADRLEARKELKTEINGETNFSMEIEAFLSKGGQVKVYPVIWTPDAFNSMPEEIF